MDATRRSPLPRQPMPPPPAVTALIVFALAMASVLQQGQALWQPRPPVPDLQGARWVQHPGGSEVLYLRRTFVVAQMPEMANLRVSAVDEFEVFLNGTRVGGEEYIGARPVGAYDILNLVKPGRNTVAIRSRSTTRGLSACAIAAVEWAGQGPTSSVTSDSNWRSEDRHRRSSLGTLSWTDSKFYDLDWTPAQEVVESALERAPLVAPELSSKRFEPISGQYLWTTDLQSTTASFERRFTLDARPVREAFLGVSATGEFLVSVNDVVLGPATTSEGRMPVFNIAPHLRRGENRVLVHVTGHVRPMRLAVLGEVVHPGSRLDFSGDDRWSVSPTGAPVRLLGEIGTRRPTLAMNDQISVKGERSAAWLVYLGYFVGIVILFLALGSGHALLVKARGQSPRAAWMAYAQILVVMTVAVGAVRLADWDPRFSLSGVYPFWLPATVLIVVVAWLAGAIVLPWMRQNHGSEGGGLRA